MNTKIVTALAAAAALMLPSCMTTYDRAGRPVQSVDPGLAAVGIIGAGLIGAAIADSNDDHKHHKHHKKYHKPVHRGHHYNHYDRRHHYHRPHYGYYSAPCRY